MKHNYKSIQQVVYHH